MIEQQERDYQWDFVCLGCNIDAVVFGTELGFAPDKSMTYVSTTVGITGTFGSVAGYRSRKRGAILGSPPAAGFSEADRRRARGE